MLTRQPTPDHARTNPWQVIECTPKQRAVSSRNLSRNFPLVLEQKCALAGIVIRASVGFWMYVKAVVVSFLRNRTMLTCAVFSV